MDGPPPYSPVDIEQTLLVSNTHRHTHTHRYKWDKNSTNTSRGALFHRLLSMINIPFQVQIIHGGIILPSKLSLSFKQYSRQSSLSENHCIHISHQSSGFRVSSTDRLLPDSGDISYSNDDPLDSNQRRMSLSITILKNHTTFLNDTGFGLNIYSCERNSSTVWDIWNFGNIFAFLVKVRTPQPAAN